MVIFRIESKIKIIGNILLLPVSNKIPIIIILVTEVNDKTANVLFLNFLCILSWKVVATPPINVNMAFIMENSSGFTSNSVNIFLYMFLLW